MSSAIKSLICIVLNWLPTWSRPARVAAKIVGFVWPGIGGA